MSTIADFNRIEDCDKISAECIDAYAELYVDEDSPTELKLDTSWGNSIVDLEPAIKAGETLTTMYLSPEENPNCLIYEPERGDNICIHGDDLSRIISMQKLKDVDQSTAISDGSVYIYNGSAGKFQPYNLQTFVNTTNAAILALQGRVTTAETAISGLQSRMSAAETAISGLQSRMSTAEGSITNHGNRLTTIETTLTPPANAPNTAKVAWGTINLYSDHNAVIDSNGAVTSLDKTHGLYTHDLNSNALEDEIMG